MLMKALNLESHARMMRSRIFRHMLETRGWKYRSFLRYLRVFKYAAFSWNRGEFLECYYTLMRYLDDIPQLNQCAHFRFTRMFIGDIKDESF